MNVSAGQVFTSSRIFEQIDFDRFARLSGDDNPIHVDPLFAAGRRFGRPVCHGMLLYSALCKDLADLFPGEGMVQLEQELMFPAPTFAGEEVTIRLAVEEPGPWLDTTWIETTVTKPGGQLACQGRTLVATDPSLFRTINQVEAGIGTSSAGTMKGLALGQRAETSRRFTSEDLAEYRDLSGDLNPLVVDLDFTLEKGLKGPLIPGGLLGGLFSFLLGTVLPGRGTNWLKQRLIFCRPAHPDQRLTAEVKILRLRPDKDLVNLRTRINDPKGLPVCDGQALVWVRDLEIG